ncbi:MULTISPECIES: FAD-binding oxidoreductase [Pseudomonas]|uniref:Oxidoreductase n=2 Tax=Pseudomonas syringae group genomosp. 2 TaxID=251698 RepID=A0AAX1W2Z3_PSEAJ|nr:MULTISPECIES: FAD-binding oxidoreductase [Pseudomonas syringae group]KEZ26083.1 2-hydroxyacid dehydrogenase [Pseudomonas amygdali pv. tabaci str. 6605]KPY77065.1 putative oxidoreductase [Pseudomonas amygdali pv. tabaci]MDU8628691.1 FAD-binding oxidoreductase [Pseudomonas syringae group sp. 243L2]RML84160.1 putative oxidoreductase [Pseudomonas amygdali pv. tabaci]RMR89301.1 putative oxidoreductase [Pseudomonas amygdali pv. tabaci]
MSEPLFAALQQLLGDSHVQRGAQASDRLIDRQGRYTGQVIAVVHPGDTEQVAEVVRLCVAHSAPVVVQGGNTGLMGAATPDASGRAVLLLLDRMNQVREIDTDNDTLTVEAGCILQDLQDAARQADRLFPLSLGAQGSCTIGGNLGTNAGGNAVLRYGNMRELTLGLEVVTAQGEIWNGLRGLRKDNTGYDLRDLFIGSEGTLGIITAATLKLFPLPKAQAIAFLAFDSLADAVAFLSHARAGLGAGLTAFELLSADCLALLREQFTQGAQPFRNAPQPWFALLELSDNRSEEHARETFETVLGDAIEQGLLADALIAESLAQGQALWLLRENMSEAQKRAGRNMKHDISVPISRVVDFVTHTDALLQAHFPGVRHFTFGHLGDGNLHYNVAHPLGSSVEAHMVNYAALSRLVHDSAYAHGGSISAEHGIGQRKRDMLTDYKSPVELDLMHRIKHALDPLNLLNPGKVLEART